MKRFIEGQDRSQSILLPECLDDFVDTDNPVRVIDAFVDELDLSGQSEQFVQISCRWLSKIRSRPCNIPGTRMNTSFFV